MEHIEGIVTIIDILLSTSRKRHIVGGVLLSFALLFAGLAITSITAKEESDDE